MIAGAPRGEYPAIMISRRVGTRSAPRCRKRPDRCGVAPFGKFKIYDKGREKKEKC